MKKLICITGIILIGCVVTSAFFAPSSSAETVESVVQTEPEDARDTQIYILKIDGGYLNVYKKGEDEPFLKTGTLSKNLPQSDASILTKGVEICGKDALRRAIEDYCS